jgi:hypothetical protein
MAKPDPLEENVHKLTRLLTGGTLEGLSELSRRLDAWEQQQKVKGEVVYVSPEESESERMRYALLGMLYDAQTRNVRRARSMGRFVGDAAKLTGKIVGRLTRPLRSTSPVRAVGSRFDRAVARGETEWERWVRIGRREESLGRGAAKTVVGDGLDDLIINLTENPTVQDLVQQQSVGLANEVVDEVRERTVSADNLVERIVRTILRRADRHDLPEPPIEIQDQAEYHPHKH